MQQCASTISDPSVPCYPQHNMGRDNSLHPPALALGTALLAAWGDTSPWASPMKEAKSGFVSAKTMKALSFSSVPVQLAFWLLVRKHLVVIYFDKTLLIPGMENEVSIPKRRQEGHAEPWRPAWASVPLSAGIKQHDFAEGNPAMTDLHQLRIQPFVSLKI